MSHHKIDGRWQDFFLHYLLEEPDDDCFVATARLDLDAIVAAYSVAVFPMGIGGEGGPPYGWFSPHERAMFGAEGPHISRSLRREFRRFTVTVDRCFERVVRACGGQDRDGDWITDDIVSHYSELHHLGLAHSVEVWSDEDLVGGLYGVGLGSFFAGESMFHRQSNASKIAVAAAWLAADSGPAPAVFDVQWQTSHLASLGTHLHSRAEAIRLVSPAVYQPGPDWCHLAESGSRELIWQDNRLTWRCRS